MRERILAAAVAQLWGSGVKNFEFAYIAARAGEDVSAVEALWPDRHRLLSEAWAAELGWNADALGAGGLEADLRRLGSRLMEPVRTPGGRVLFRSSLPIDDDPNLTAVRAEFWNSQFENATDMMRAAHRQGGLRDGIDPADAARMFCTAMYFNTLYFDAEIPDDYLDCVVDVFLRGVARNRIDVTEVMRRDIAERVGGVAVDVLGEVNPAADFSRASTVQIRAAILDAAIKETAQRGSDFVTRDVIARRAGVTTAVVERMWANDGDLLRDAGKRAREKTRPVPDSGALASDLMAFVDAKARLVSTADARKHYLSTIPRGSSGRNTATVVEFWAAGLRETTQILVQADRRGDLRDGINPDFATRALVVSLYYELFFNRGPMRPDYTVTVLDVFLNGAGPTGDSAV